MKPNAPNRLLADSAGRCPSCGSLPRTMHYRRGSDGFQYAGSTCDGCGHAWEEWSVEGTALAPRVARVRDIQADPPLGNEEQLIADDLRSVATSEQEGR